MLDDDAEGLKLEKFALVYCPEANAPTPITCVLFAGYDATLVFSLPAAATTIIPAL